MEKNYKEQNIFKEIIKLSNTKMVMTHIILRIDKDI